MTKLRQTIMKSSIIKFPLLLIFLFLNYQSVFSQCSIKTSATSCIGTVIDFEALSTQSIDSVLWDFGDQSSGKQIKLSHKYNKADTFEIILKVYRNGDSCIKKQKIIIYEGPDVKVSIDSNSSYCLSGNKICLNDSSLRGSSKGKIKKRTILWGDGNRTVTNNPTFGSKICHTYGVAGVFDISIQEENEFGCITEQVIKKVTIFKDFPLGFKSRYLNESCTWESHMFINDSLKRRNTIDSFEWDWGDGSRDTSKFDSIAHSFNHKGTYTVTLRVYLKNGCINEVSKNILIDFKEIKVIASASDDTICNKQNIILSADKTYGTEWKWNITDTANVLPPFQSEGRLTYYAPTTPGVYYVSLKIIDGSCSKFKMIDTIEVVGIEAKMALLNNIQCSNLDTVYGCNQSITRNTNNFTYYWNFGDTISPQCTTYRNQNLNIDSNCNFEVGPNGQHFYRDSFCGYVTLVSIDHDNGCVDSTSKQVVIAKAEREQFKFSANRFCVGNSFENAIKFEKHPCLPNVKVNYDSICDPDFFEPYIDYFGYRKVCDSLGRVTVGFATQSGHSKIYRSCDTTDFFIDSSRECIDTFWFHHWYQLQKQPDPSFYIDTQFRCAPANLTFKLYNDSQENVKRMHWIWNDGTDSGYFVPSNYDTILPISHNYLEEKRYRVSLFMETTKGCKSDYARDYDLGYFNNLFPPIDTCVNDTFRVIDSLYYFGESFNYWRNIHNTSHVLSWDFGDGKGFSTTGPLPKYAYDKPGTYTIRMASKDSLGCRDTAEQQIDIACVDAGIRHVTQKLICGGVIRFFDSSSTKLGLDRINFHFWDFGDNTTPSYVQNPFHYYRKFGKFQVMHVVGSEGNCFDTAYYEMHVEGPGAHFEIVSDSIGCNPLRVELKNNSINSSRYIWEFGDSANVKWTTLSDTNVFFNYTKPGTYFIHLFALDSVFNPTTNEYEYCESLYPDTLASPRIYKKVVVLPIPKADFDIPAIICKNQEIELIDKSDTTYKDYHWKISNGDQVRTIQPTAYYTFTDTGTFTILYAPKYPAQTPAHRCYDSLSKTINVNSSEAIIDLEKDEDCPIYSFTNRSINGDTFYWDFGHPNSGELNTSTENSVTHDFSSDPGTFNVCLFITSDKGCKDTACEQVESKNTFDLFIPNIFTPNKDGYNEEYEIAIESENKYELLIYNRWGEKIFESKVDSELGEGKNWDGTNPDTGKEYPAGVYYYIFKYESACTGESGESQGTITLVR